MTCRWHDHDASCADHGAQMTAVHTIPTRESLADQAMAEAADWFREEPERFEWTVEMVRAEVLATFDVHESTGCDATYRQLAVAAALAILARGPEPTEDDLADRDAREDDYFRLVSFQAFGEVR